MKQSNRKWKGRLSVLLAAALVISGASFLAVRAVWDESRAVHIRASEIEDSTLAVGTHLIHLSALTEPLYAVATASADESGQDSIYYKSELADGTWFDITTASSLDSITTEGTPVDNSVIEALFFTHHTKSDGITYDLRTGKPVSIQDIQSPYDLESMPELFPLKTQYDLIKDQQSDSAAGRAKIARIREFFATSVKNSVTDGYDRSLAALQVYYNILSDNGGGKPEMEAVQAVMDAVDAARRAQVFAIVDEALNTYAVELQKVADTEDEEGNVTAGSGSDTNLQSAVNDSLSNVTESRTEQEGKMLSEGTTIMSRVKYRISLRLIADAETPDHAACDQDVAELIALQNIMNGVVADKALELRFLEDTLLPEATDQYLAGLASGINAEYRAALAANTAKVLLDTIAAEQKNSLSSYRNELEFYITARCIRLDNTPAKEFIAQRLEQAYTYGDRVPEDAFARGAGQTVDAHIDFLLGKLRELELQGGGNDLDKLIAQKADLQTALMSALDDNDLETAAGLESQISALDGLIDALSGGDYDGGIGQLIAELKAACMDVINGGETDPGALGDGIGALTALLDENAKAAFPALTDIRDAMVAERDLNGTSSFDDEIAAVEQAILDNKAAYDAAMRPELDSSDLDAVAGDYFSGGGALLAEGSSLTSGDAGDPSGLSDGDKALVNILALKLYYDETGSQNALNLANSKTQQQVNLGNPLMFERINDVSGEFLPVTAISAYTGLRYVWRSSYNKAILARGGDYYTFTVYSDQVERSLDGARTDTMTGAARFQTVVHIPNDYCLTTFGVEAIYVPGGDYGVASSDTLMDYARTLFEAFLEEAASRAG